MGWFRFRISFGLWVLDSVFGGLVLGLGELVLVLGLGGLGLGLRLVRGRGLVGLGGLGLGLRLVLGRGLVLGLGLGLGQLSRAVPKESFSCCFSAFG